MANGINCAQLTSKQRALIRNRVNCDGISDQRLDAIVTRVSTESGIPQELLVTKENLHLLNAAVAQSKNQKTQEDFASETRLTIGDAKVYVGGYWSNTSAVDNPETIYVFSDNLQAHNYTSDSPTNIDGLLPLTDAGVKRLNVTSSSAVVRTNSEGTVNSNAVGIVVKKNAYDKDGKTINSDEDQFTDKETETVITLAKETVEKIKEMAASGKYKSIRIVDCLAGSLDSRGRLSLGRAKLTQKNAQAIADMFRKELGLESQVLLIEAGKPWYAVVFQDPKGSSKKVSVAELKKKAATKQKQEEAKKSLEAADPTSQATKEALQRNSEEYRQSKSALLDRVFNSYQERISRANLLFEMVQAGLNLYIDEAVEEVSKKDDKLLDEVIDGDHITYRQLLIGLTEGDVQDQHIFALKHLRKNGSLFQHIINKVFTALDTYTKPYLNEDGTFKDGNWRDDAVRQFFIGTETLEPDAIWSEEFMAQADQEGWLHNGELTPEGWKNARIKAENIVRACQQMSDRDVFEALIGDIVFDLELIENIRITQYSREAVTLTQDPNIDFDEGKEDANHEGYMVKYKLLDPSSSLSIRMKRFLGSMYKVVLKDGVEQYTFDSLGRRVRMNASAAYYTILQATDGMITEEDMDPMLYEAMEQCPWLKGVRDVIIYNPEATDENGYNPYDHDMRVEFYTTFRMSNTKFGKLDSMGFLVRLNKDAKVGTFMERIASNFEGHIVLGPQSIYDEDGQINLTNATKIHSLFNPTKNSKGRTKSEEELKRDHPLDWVSKVFDRNNSRHTAANILEALRILRGEVGEHKNAKLTGLLQNIGVDTSTLSVDEGLLPAIEDEDVAELVRSGEVSGPLQAVTEIIGSKRIANINRVLNAIRIITNTSNTSRGLNVLREDDNIINKFHGAYLSISGVLIDLSDGITKTSFRGPDGHDRYSFTAPDFITDFIDAMHNSNEAPYESVETIPQASEQYVDLVIEYVGASTDEFQLGEKYACVKYPGGYKWVEYKGPAQFFLMKNFGIMDYFRNQKTGEWNNVWLKELYNNPDARETLDYLNILSMYGKDSFGKALDINIGEVQKKDLIENSFFAYLASSNSKEGTPMGYYQNPLFSDVAAMLMIRMPRYTDTDQVVDNLVKVFEQEIARIRAVRAGDNSTKIDFYNDGPNNGAKFNLLVELNKGIKSYTTLDGTVINIPSLEEIITELDNLNETNDSLISTLQRHMYVKDILSDLMKYEFDRFMRDLDLDKDAIYKKYQKQQAKIANKGIQNEIDEETSMTIGQEDTEEDEDEQVSIDEQTERKVNQLLKEYFYNSFFAQSQMIQIFGGDLAYYKNFRDFIKRNKQAYASGKRLYARDENGKELFENCLYCEDIEGFSNTFGVIRNLLDSSNTLSQWEKDNLKGAVATFTNICKTDGFSLRTVDSFKKIFKAMGGRWNAEIEEAFDNLREGVNVTSAFRAIIEQMKPFLYSYEMREINGRTEKIPVLHKNSEYLLGALMGAMVSSLSNSSVLRGLQRFMEANNYDVIHFHSVVKEGFFNAVDLSYNKEKFEKLHPDTEYSKWKKQLDSDYKNGKISTTEYNKAFQDIAYADKSDEDAVVRALEEQTYLEGQLNPDMVHTFSLRDLMIVQPSKEHLVDEEALFGSQLRNIIPADLPADFTMEVVIGTDKEGKKIFRTLNRDEAVQYYNTLLVDQLMDSFRRVSSEFSSLEKLHDALMAKMAGNQKYGEDIKKALELKYDKDGKAVSFMLPFTSPNLTNKIEELILSAFKNAIQKLHINGGNAYLISDFGLSDKLHVHWKTKDGRALSIEEAEKHDKDDLCIDYIPCYLPYQLANQLEDFCHMNEDGYYEFDFELMKQTFGEQGVSKILDIIGYRIPTEDKYSIMPIRVVGYLPIQAGSSMVLPSDIIAMSGTDFDIDKLFLMIRSVRRDVYSRDLRKAYAQWLVERNEGMEALLMFAEQVDQFKEPTSSGTSLQALFDVLSGKPATTEDHKIAKKLLNKAGDLTSQEVASFEQNALFREFMEVEGYKYTLKDDKGNNQPKYRILTPLPKYDEEGNLDLDAMSKSASKDERNNMLIDVIQSVLTSNAGTKLSMLPGSYPTVKYASRMQRILHDNQALEAFQEKFSDLIEATGGTYAALESLRELSKVKNVPSVKALIEAAAKKGKTLTGVQILESHYDEFATTQSPLSILDYANNFRNLMDGNDLIGVYAVNSSSHYKFQFLDLKLKKPAQFMVNGQMIENIDPINSPLNGLRVGRICAELQAASPDNGKDPTLGDLNASKNTSAFMGFLARIGLDLISIGTINNTRELLAVPGITDTKRFPESKRVFNLDVNRIGELYVRLKMSASPEDFVNNSSLDDLQYLADYYYWFKRIDGYSVADGAANQLNAASAISRSDSPNGALPVSIAEATMQKMKAMDFILDSKGPDFAITGFDEFIDITIDPTDYEGRMDEFRARCLSSKVPRMQAVYSLGIAGGYSLCKRWLPTMSDAAFKSAQKLREQARTAMVSSKYVTTWKKYFNQMLMYLMTDSELFGTELEGKTLMEKRNFYMHDFPMKYRAFCMATDGEGHYLHLSWRQTSAFNSISNKSEKGLHFESVTSASKSKLARRTISSEFNHLIASDNFEEAQMALSLLMYSFFENGLAFRHNSFGLFFDTDFLRTIPGLSDLLQEVAIKLLDDRYIAGFNMLFMINNPDLIPSVRKVQALRIGENTIAINRQALESVRSGTKRDGNPVKLVRYAGGIYYLIDEIKLVYRKINGSIPGKTLYYDRNLDIDEIKYEELLGMGIIAKTEDKAKKHKSKASGDAETRIKEMKGVDGNDEPTASTEEPEYATPSADAAPNDSKDPNESNAPVELDMPAGVTADKAAVFEAEDLRRHPNPKDAPLDKLNDGETKFC